jgi:hypothetical protein
MCNEHPECVDTCAIEIKNVLPFSTKYQKKLVAQPAER